MLPPGEMVEADKGYRGEPFYVRVPDSAVSNADKKASARARARQETINSRLKSFGCLSQRFRHPLDKHCVFFTAVAVMVQSSIMLGEEPWQIRY